MRRVEQKFLNLVKENKLIQAGDNILLALSGGPDSVFLLHMLSKYLRKFKIRIGTAHLNHSLRGESSEEDELFCKELSHQLDVQYFSKKLDIKKLSRERKKSIEETARDERYLFFSEIAQVSQFNKIATAHNLNDNSETVLLNLIKGTGLRGISGIPLTRGKIIRPILNISKEEILNYLDINKIPYRTDTTNESEIYERNFIRHKLLPLVRQSLNPSVDNSIFNSSRVFSSELEILNDYVKSVSAVLVRTEEDIVVIDLAKLNAYNQSVIGELLREVIRNYFSQDIEYNDFRKVKDLISNQVGKRIFLSGKLFAYKDRDKLYIGRVTGYSNDETEIIVNVNETCFFNNNELRIADRSETKNFVSSKLNELISADDLDESFLLRKWKNGDKFIPLGMKNFKKVSDFLTEQKIPSFRRKEQLVLINNDKIVWLPGLRIDDRVKIRKDTKRIYELWMNQRS